jgi:hypothetical protein
VPGIGDRGQEAISAAVVRVEGTGLAAEVCALYLAGAGIQRLEVDADLVDRCRAINREIAVDHNQGGARAPSVVRVAILADDGGELARRSESVSGGVEAGATLARWALESVVSSAMGEGA